MTAARTEAVDGLEAGPRALEMIEEYLSGLPALSRLPRARRGDALRAAAGGKRIRPRLCLAAAAAGGADPAAALPAAAALELIQAFSLVHDDLPALDDDDERRGRPTAHVAFGEAVAVLAGDGLLNAAFRLVDRLRSARACGSRLSPSWRPASPG